MPGPFWTRSALAAAAFTGGLLAAIGARDATSNSPFVPPGVRPYSVQLHAHGPFSEGSESLETATWEAHALGLDAIWWSDHDWRVQFFRHVSRFSFDDWSEPLAAREPWTPNHDAEVQGLKGFVMEPVAPGFSGTEAVIETGAGAFEGTGALKLSGASSSPTFERLAGSLDSARDRHLRSLAAEVALEIAIRPGQVSNGARPFVQVVLSKHRASPTATLYPSLRIQYFLVAGGGAPFRSGATWFVPVDFTPGQWQLHRFDVSADARAGFAPLDGDDNVLASITLGIESRNGTQGTAWFDDLRIEHGMAGEPLMQVQRTMLADAELALPAVRQHQGLEVSYWRHMNVFAESVPLYDYDQLVADSGLADAQGWVADTDALRDFIARAVVADVRARGGVVSYNHLLGTGTVPSFSHTAELQRLIDAKVFGVDVLEVGYRARGGYTLAEHLWMWDELARAGYPLVGTGVSDSHGTETVGHWATQVNNFVTWIYATSIEKQALVAGLAGGRAYFGDPTRFAGALDLRSDAGHLMGAIVVSDAPAAAVELAIDDLEAGDVLTVVRNGAVSSSFPARGPRLLQSLPLDLGGEEGAAIRVELADATGAPKAFSNPLTFVRSVPEKGISPARAAFVLGALRSVRFDAFYLEAAAHRVSGSAREVVLRGFSRAPGTIVVDTSAVAGPVTASFAGALTGSPVVVGSTLELRDLAGEGEITLRY